MTNAETMRSSQNAAGANLNPNLAKRSGGLSALSAEAFAQGICRGDRVLLSRAITLLESRLPRHREMGLQILNACLPCRTPSFRVGITGAPGAGKSTFIEALGQYAIAQGHRVAVPAIDPSSKRSGGSILGDKTRMTSLAASDHAYIRPSPAGDALGGVARTTRETILLCEAAGYDLILVETVGVGQSEVAVHDMVDCFLLLLLPGAGDELQGIKRGIIEMADLLAVNKADGERIPLAKRAQAEYRNALHLFPPKDTGWTPRVLTCSATTGEGMAEVWNALQDYRQSMTPDTLAQRRRHQDLEWLHEHLLHELWEAFSRHPQVLEQLPDVESAVQSGKLAPSAAAKRLLEIFLRRNDTAP